MIHACNYIYVLIGIIIAEGYWAFSTLRYMHYIDQSHVVTMNEIGGDISFHILP